MVSAGKQGFDSLLLGAGGGLELEYPARIVSFGSWQGHTPFAIWLIEALKPRMVVELGVHGGNSYCAFLQAVAALGLDTRCFGIGHWQGDERAGHDGDEVYNELSDYHDARYGTFSRLVRSSFDAALPDFSDGNIDLLHIDGFHSYEAASANFTSWLPKASSRGVALFHKINIRDHGFGIWKLWNELTSRFPHFEFSHCHGLGIVYLGTESLTGSLKALFAARTDAEIASIQDYFARLGISVVERLATQTLAARVEMTKAQVKALEAELATFRTQLVRSNECAESLAKDLEVTTLQAQMKTSMMRQRMVAVARLQRELLAANLEKRTYQRQFNEILQSRSWRVTEPMRKVVTKLRRLLPLDRKSLGSSRAAAGKS